MGNASSQAELPAQGTACMQETLRRVMAVLAQQEGMAGRQKQMAHGSRLFYVPSGWQGRALGGAEGVTVCANVRELDAAVRDANKPVIFLPVDAMMTEEDIEKVCRRHGVVKTLFWEEKNA